MESWISTKTYKNRVYNKGLVWKKRLKSKKRRKGFHQAKFRISPMPQP